MRKVLALAAVLLLPACGDPLTDYVNSKFPPVSADEQRNAVLQETAASLGALNGPNLALGAAFADVQEALLTQDIKDKGVTSIVLTGDRSLVKAEVDFDRTFEDGGVGGLVGSLKPRVVGTVTVWAGVGGAVAETSAGDTSLVLKVHPVFDSIRVHKVEVRGRYDVTALGGALAEVLERFADNVSGALSALEAMKIEVPTGFAEKKDPSKVVRIQGGDFEGNVTVTGQPVGPPVKLRAVAFGIAGDRLVGIAQLVPVSGMGAEGDRAPVTPTEEVVAEVFRTAVREGFGLDAYPDKVWAAVRKDVVAHGVNAVVGQAKLCARGTGSIARQEFSEQVTFPDETTVDCTPTRDCSSNRSCDLPRSHDTRDCNACILRNIFTGGCSQRGNDPLCEAAKAAQNKIYDADYAARKLDCERLKSTEKLTCEAEKSGEKALCETGKEFLKRLARTGKFANIEGSFQGSVDVGACMAGFALASDLSQVKAHIDFDGRAEGDLHVKFVPLDIVGHLSCQVPWTEDQKVRAEVPRTTVPLEAAVRLVVESADAPHYEFGVQPAKLSLKLNPSPMEFMLTSMNMTLACQGLNLVKPLLLPATAFVPQLRGDFDYEVKGSTVSLNLEMPKVAIGGHTVVFFVGETESALVLNAGMAGVR